MDDCQALFGPAVNRSENGSFCRCADANLTFHQSNQCCMLEISFIRNSFVLSDYFIEIDLGNIDPDSACPSISKVRSKEFSSHSSFSNHLEKRNRCTCSTGYVVNSLRTTCGLYRSSI